MGSTRLPGKVLKEVDGIPLLGYQLKRMSKSKLIDKTIVATSTSDSDDVIVEFCKQNNVKYFRGSENDVLARYYECAKTYNADIIIRLTGDCPLSDPQVIDDTVRLYIDTKTDYAANTIPVETSKYPDGFDVEVFGMNSLERAYMEAKDPCDREHVTFYFWKHDNGFKAEQLDNIKDYSEYRLTVDYPEDFEVVEFVVKELSKRKCFGHLDEIIEIIKEKPEIKTRNSKYYSGIGWEKREKMR